MVEPGSEPDLSDPREGKAHGGGEGRVLPWVWDMAVTSYSF